MKTVLSLAADDLSLDHSGPMTRPSVSTWNLESFLENFKFI